MRKIFYLIPGLLLVTTVAVELFAGPMPHRPHHGRHHGMHGMHPGIHSRGFEGQGICPQRRATAKAPEDIYNQKNPLKPDSQNVYAGEALYQVDAQPTACKVCHGAEGNGFGMMAPGMDPPPRNFACAETMNEISDGQLFWIIRNGSPGTGMPPYPNLSDRQIWQIILYLRRFSR